MERIKKTLVRALALLWNVSYWITYWALIAWYNVKAGVQDGREDAGHHYLQVE